MSTGLKSWTDGMITRQVLLVRNHNMNKVPYGILCLFTNNKLHSYS